MGTVDCSEGGRPVLRGVCAECVCARVHVLSHVRLFATLWTAACQVPLSMGVSQARILERVCHFLLQGIFLTQGLNLGLLCLLHCRQILYC